MGSASQTAVAPARYVQHHGIALNASAWLQGTQAQRVWAVAQQTLLAEASTAQEVVQSLVQLERASPVVRVAVRTVQLHLSWRYAGLRQHPAELARLTSCVQCNHRRFSMEG